MKYDSACSALQLAKDISAFSTPGLGKNYEMYWQPGVQKQFICKQQSREN